MENTPGFVFTLGLSGDGSADPINANKWNTSDLTLWFHLDLSNETAKTWLVNKSGLSEITIEALTAEDTRPRITACDNGLLICLRAVNCSPGADSEDMVSLRLWISRNRVISLRYRRVEAVTDIKNSLANSDGPESTGSFIATMCERITDRINEVVHDVEDAIDDIEEQLLEMRPSTLRVKLSGYRRMIIQLRRYLAPQRDMLTRLQTETTGWILEVNKIQLRESTERTIRCLEDLDSTRDRAAVIQEELNARLTEQMNQTIYIMSIVATIFLPLSLLTGLLGINVGGIPGTNSPRAFIIVCIILLIMAIGEFFFFKRKQVI